MPMPRVFKIGVLVFRTVVCFALLYVFVNIGFHINSGFLNPVSGSRIPADIRQEYNYIKAILDSPDPVPQMEKQGSTIFMTQEFAIMIPSLAAFGMRNLALKDPSLRLEAASYISKAIEQLKNPKCYRFLVNQFGDPFKDENIRDNAFYLGHLTLALAYYREVSGDSRYDELFHRFAKAFYQNYKNSPTLCLNSYTDYAWTSEQAVPLAALKIHDDIFGTNYKEVIYAWEKKMRAAFIDKESGLLVKELDVKTGFHDNEVCMIPNAWTILFLHNVLPEFTRKLYVNMRRELLIKRLGFPLFKEFFRGRQRMTCDTGPIVWGVSPSGTVFGMGCAAIMNDGAVYQPIRYLSNLIGLSVNWGSQRKYLCGGRMGTVALFWVKTESLFTDVNKYPLPIKNILVIDSALFLLFLWVFWMLKVVLRSWRQN